MRDNGKEKTVSTVVDEFFKNSVEEEKLVISINEWRGQDYIDFRWYWKPDGQENFIPTKKGVSLSVDHFDKLKNAMAKAAKVVEEK